MVENIRFLVGVDGGGTSCRAVIAERNGDILGKAQSGSSNIATNFDSASANISEAIAKAAIAAGLDDEAWGQSAACLGLAGAMVGDFAQRLVVTLPFAKNYVCGDAEIALQGALGDQDGAIAILGTGSAFMARKGEKTRRVGGWGYQLSDLGGGARLGRAALEMALLAHDGIIKHSALTHELLAHFSNVAENLVFFAKSATPSDFGAFAPHVIKHVSTNDGNALKLFHDSAQTIDAAFDALHLGGADMIALLGGLSEHYPPYLAERHRNRLRPAHADALTGALQLAAQLADGKAPAHWERIRDQHT